MINVKLLRGEMELTQKELGDYLGVTRTTVINVENDPKYILTEDKARRLADLFKTDVFEITDIASILSYVPKDKEEWQKLVDAITKQKLNGNE